MSTPLIHVIGDVMLDIDARGQILRQSPENQSIPVVATSGLTYHLGGAANVAALAAREGANVVLFGAVGNDWAGALVAEMCVEAGIDAILSQSLPVTTTKIRAFDGTAYVSRTDIEAPVPVLGAIPSSLDPVDVVVLSDYHKGVFSTATSADVRELLGSLSCPVIVDCKPTDYLKSFRGATVMTPNRKEIHEMAAVLGVHGRNLVAMTDAVRRELEMQAVAVTLGGEGSLIVDDQGFAMFPAQGVKDPQVVGAGDAFTVGMAIGLTRGTSLHRAAKHAANYSGTYVSHPR